MATLGVYRVRNYFHHWVVVARIKVMHGLHLRKARHRQRDRHLKEIEKVNKELYEQWKAMVTTYDTARSMQDLVAEHKILRHQIAEQQYVRRWSCIGLIESG